MRTRAAVLVETGKPLVVATLEVPALRLGQVLVEMAYSGVCHTQLLECRGYRGVDRYLPHCLGHEGSGVVIDAGPGVSRVKAGDRVILSWIKGPGAEAPGAVYHWDGRPVNAGGITTFNRHAVISENRVTVIQEDISMRQAALLGCAVPTGVGAVLNAAEVRPGDSVAVFGMGGIGFCAMAGALLAGASPVIALDVREERLALALQNGATHAVDARGADPIQAIRAICPQGVDAAIEATGTAAAMQQALECVRSQGGKAVIVGNARHGQKLALDPWQLNQGKRLLGTWGGDTVPERDLPRYCRLLHAGTLKLDALASQEYDLGQINQALEALEQGEAIRPLINLSLTESEPIG